MTDIDIDNEIIPEDLPPKVQAVKSRRKPSVEGINAPVVKSSRTSPSVLAKNMEAIVPQEPAKIILPSMVKDGSTGGGRLLLSLLGFILLLVFGYYAYGNYFPKQSAESAELSMEIKAPEVNTEERVLNSAFVSTTTTSTMENTQPTPTPTPIIVNRIVVDSTSTGYLNVRGQPSTSAKLLTRVSPGEAYEYLAVQNDWYQIVLKDGQTGWVSGTYVTKQ